MTSAWRADATRLVRTVTRDDRLPVYLVERSDADDRFDHMGSWVEAIAGVNLDLQCRDLIGSDWQGRGFATLIWSGRLRQKHPDPSQFERRILETVLHELGHWADTTEDDARQPDSEIDPLFQEAWVRLAQRSAARTAERTAERESAGLVRPWDGHELSWTRMMIHIAHRATKAGFRADPDNLTVAGRRYGLSHVDAYRFALGDEPSRLEGIPLTEVPFHDLPDRMNELFQMDVERYESQAGPFSPCLAQAATT